MAKQSKYHTHVEPRLNEIAKWRRDGYTEKQIVKMRQQRMRNFIEDSGRTRRRKREQLGYEKG